MIGWSEIIQNIIYFISLYYVVFWLIVLLDSDDMKPKRIKRYPTVSIIIPAYNEEENIVQTIKSAISLDYPKDKISIIVIDDGSSDSTYVYARDYIENMKVAHPSYRSLKVLKQENKGKFAAMNYALKVVDSEFFATLDADSMPLKDALKKIIGCFHNKNIAAVSSVLKVYKPSNTLQVVQWLEYSVNHFYKSVISKVNAIHVIPGPLSVYRTCVLREIKGFRHAHKTEDMEVAMRIQKKDYTILQCNDAFVYTKAPYTLGALYRQRHRWSYGTFKNLIDYRRMMFNRKYGDFGMFQLPVILISGLLGISILGLMLYDFIKGIKPTIRMLDMYNFNIIEYLRHTTFNVIWLDLDLKSFVTFAGFFIISLLIFWLSLRLYKEKYSIKNVIPFVFYLFFYYIFLAIVWLGVFKDVLLQKESGWKK